MNCSMPGLLIHHHQDVKMRMTCSCSQGICGPWEFLCASHLPNNLYQALRACAVFPYFLYYSQLLTEYAPWKETTNMRDIWIKRIGNDKNIDGSQKSEIKLQSWTMIRFQKHKPLGFCFLSLPSVSLLPAESMAWPLYSLKGQKWKGIEMVSCCCCSVTQLCPTLCNLMDCSMFSSVQSLSCVWLFATLWTPAACYCWVNPLFIIIISVNHSGCGIKEEMMVV